MADERRAAHRAARRFNMISEYVSDFLISCPDRLSGAGFGAFAAVHALVIVDDGEIILHGDRAFRTRSGAFAAPDAPVCARVHDGFAALVRGARNVDLRVGGNAREQPFGAGEHTRAARNTFIGIDVRLFVCNADRVFGADARAVSVSETAVLAHFASA